MPEIQGTLIEIYDEVQVTEKFKKLTFVLLYHQSGNQAWADYISFELHSKNTSLLDNYNIGDSVKVHFNWRGRPWRNKEGKLIYFNTLAAWKIERVAWENKTNVMPQSQEDWNNTKKYVKQEDDDLPF